jgi:predicted nucleic acid-binding Zn ribbon protein
MTTGAPSLDLTQPHDVCVRCGKPTPQGVALCDDDNPAALKGPSTTQVHGTIAVGIGVGFLVLALVANWALSSVGPFPTRVLAATALADGGADVVFTVTNEGGAANIATCRITRGGVSTPNDPVFRTATIEAGGSIQIARTVPPPALDDPPWVPERLYIHCS